MTSTQSAEPWWLYLRKSVVKDDKDAESINIQRERCTKYVESVGGYVAGEFVDEGISASKGLERPDFNRMLRGIDDGTVKRLCVREQARISREAVELFVFLRQIEKAETVVRDSYGHEIKNDILTQIKGLFDADYARSVKRNSTERQESIAASGKPPGTGHRPYGYEKNYAAVIEEEAKVIRECAERVIAGETLYSIVKDLNKRGIRKYTGKTWKSQDLSKVLGRSENAGIRTYKGEETAKGSWPTILDEKTYRKVKEQLAKNTAYSTTTARKYLLSGILVCSLCGVKLSAKNPSYWCNPNRGGCGKVTRNLKAVDDYMLRRTYEYIKRLPKPSDEPANAKDDTEEKIAKLDADREEIMQAKKDGEISFRDWRELVADIDAKKTALRKEQNKHEPLPVDDAQAFLEASIDKQRDTIRRIYPVVGVKPTGKKGTRFNPDQLDF